MYEQNTDINYNKLAHLIKPFWTKHQRFKNWIEEKNAIDFTLGGNGLFASLNYNRAFFVKQDHFLNASIGIGTIPLTGGTCIPHQLTMNYGLGKSFFELGIDGSFWKGTEDDGYSTPIQSYHISPIIGWRKNIKKHIVFRIYANPLIRVSGVHFIEDYDLVYYGGLSLGFRF